MPTTESRLLELQQQVVPRGVSQVHPAVADGALGGKIWDVDGREYLDWIGGIGGQNVGWVVWAVMEQLERPSPTCFQVTAYEPPIRLAEKLCPSAPGDFEMPCCKVCHL